MCVGLSEFVVKMIDNGPHILRPFVPIKPGPIDMELKARTVNIIKGMVDALRETELYSYNVDGRVSGEVAVIQAPPIRVADGVREKVLA